MRHLLAIIFILLLLMGVVGCSVEKKAAKKTSWLLAHDLMDDECARLYPNKDSISKGDTVTNLDTLYIENEIFIRDTVVKDGKTIYIEKKCPPHQTITVTKFVHDTIYRTNDAEVQRQISFRNDLEKTIKEKDAIIVKQQKNLDKDNWWKIAAIVTWFAIVLLGVFRVFVLKRPI